MPPPTADSADASDVSNVSAKGAPDGTEDTENTENTEETERTENTENTEDAEAVARVMEKLPGWVNGDAALVRRGRFVELDCLIDAGGTPFYLSIREGRITSMLRGPALMRPWRFCIGVSAEGLRRFWAPMPEPGWHDLFALTKRGEAVLEGDLVPLMANLRYFKELLATPRRHLDDPVSEE